MALTQEEKYTNRDTLIKHGEMLSDTNYKLKDSVRVMHETLEINDSIGIELRNQSSKMRANKERLIEIREDVGKSDKHIRSMMLRIRKNKLVLAGVFGLVVLVGIVIMIVHFK